MATLFVDNLTVLDFSYLHAKRGLVGDSWIVDLELSGDLDDQSMVFDFGRIKKSIKHALDDIADHKLLAPADSEHLNVERIDDRLQLRWQYPNGEILMRAPESSSLLVPGMEVSKGAVTLYLTELVRASLPSNITEVLIRLREENTGTSPYYHYSHGLKKHDGNCQRIAHGHRSRIEIFENGRRSRYWEKLWADRWEDIYIGTEEDLEGTYYLDEIPHHRFRYTSEQGLFELMLPEDNCYLVASDSTVELLAEHIAKQLADEAPGKHFVVRAYEGVSKGALAEAGQMRI
ncbi:MAG: 6-carboxytetrahydropterin synthase [Alcanivoracaceae bacterium]|nr:6-carboxytetrahydropterin synthase [Alcanivoracaceae bacterium]